MTTSRHLPRLAAAASGLAIAGLAGLQNGPAAAQAPQTAAGAAVIVATAGNACFSDLVRVTGFIAARRLAVANVDSEGFRVAEVLVKEGDTVSGGQDLARLIPPAAPGAAPGAPVSLKAPAAGLIIEVMTRAGAPASPQAPPMFKLAVNGELEMDAEVPSIHLLKLQPGASARIGIGDGIEISGHVRLVAAEIDPRTQLGHVRLTIASHPALRIGMFAKATIAARRSCGVSVPSSAVDHQTVQVVANGVIETRSIRTGLTSDVNTEVLSGLKEGEIVVANAGTSLHDGDRVRIVAPEDADQPKPR